MNQENIRYKELGDFLKTRRARVVPSQVGLPTTSRRRTPGLRREEVAGLAGIGLTWYTWLEQGRPIHVSEAVVESLSKVLMLDDKERMHLYYLANQPCPNNIQISIRAISDSMQHVLDSLVLCPSLIMDQRWNVIGWNKEATLLFGDFTKMSARECNIVWEMFTNKRYKELFDDWNAYAKRLVGGFRATCGQYIEDPWLVQFVEELKEHSVEFAEWWTLHEIDDSSEKYKEIHHPKVGILHFEVSNFEVIDQMGLKLIVHVPTPGTDTDKKMKLLLEEV